LSFTRIFRIGAVVLLLFVLAIIFIYFVKRSRRESQPPVEAPQITQSKIEKKDYVEHLEFKGEKGNLQVRAKKHFVDDENWNHLKGDVEVIFFKKREGKDLFIYGDEVIYDKEWNHFRLSGRVRVKFKDMMVKTVLLNYDRKKDSFRSDKGVHVSSKKLQGFAQKVIYFVDQERVELEGKINLEIKPNIETAFPLIARGKRLDYSQKERWGTMEGDVRLFHGESRGSADFLRFDLSPDGENIKTVLLKGKVKAILVNQGEENDSSSGQSSFFDQCVKREVRADEVELQAFQDISEVQAVKAKGNCSFKFISSSGSFRLFQAEDIRFTFDSDRDLEDFIALKDARMTDQDEESGERRIVEGYTMTFKGRSEAFQIKGQEQIRARAMLANSEIIAEQLELFLDNKDLEAEGSVRITLESQNEKKESIGFFSEKEPIFIIAQKMRYSGTSKRFIFNKDVKIWQEKKIQHAEIVVMNEEKGEIICLYGVKSIFPHKPREKEDEEKVEISAESMEYMPDEKLILYRNKCALKVRDFSLNSLTVTVELEEEEAEVKEVVAQKDVVIIQKGSEGRGEEAIYDPDEETVVLLGNPVLIDKNKGMTKGDKLTFYIADGRIVVENKEKERSETVIKS